MRVRTVCLLACVAVFSLVRAEEKNAEPSSHMKEILKAKLAEEAKKQAAAPSAPAPVAKEKTAPSPVAAPPASPVASPVAPTASTPPRPPAAAKPKDQPATVLPQVEVKRSRITELDLQIQKQEHDIELEKKNTQATEVDKALNNSKVSKVLSIFGGESSRYREHVASERVQLMEAEKDILEAMKSARTKEEKAALQAQLDQLRDARRNLETSMR